jgi:hypothetical protein
MTQKLRTGFFYWIGLALVFSLSGCTGSVGGGEDASCLPGTYQNASGCLPCTEAAHCGAQCQDCTALSTNRACIDGTCGCATPADCVPGEWCANSACSASAEIALYVVPPIRDTKILPDSGPPATAESYEISVAAALGEYEPASFVVRPKVDLSGLVIEATPLTSATGAVISSDNVDIRVVKCWWQAGVEIWDNEASTKTFTPELLLKDDALVKVEGEENYLRLNGEYVWISEWNLAQDGSIIHTIEEYPVQDAAILQPFDIPTGTNKQVWITIKVPADAAPGTYHGRLLLRRASGETGSVGLQVEVLPFSLEKSGLTYSIYYRGVLRSDWPNGSISSEWKSEGQLRAELKNMFDHGVTNPTVYQGFNQNLLGKVLEARRDLGMDQQPLYFLGMGTGNSSDPAVLQALKQRVQDLIAFVTPYGITDVYIYGIDERYGDELLAQQPAWQAVREGGGKVFVAGGQGPTGNFALMGDIQDLLICANAPSADEAAKWHGVQHLIFNYANPQVGNEQPERYRRNYGLLLWQQDYDGAMDYAYQHSFGSIWNDFDHIHYRDHVFAYPTVDGVIDTIEWEGFREGVDDVRYLTTLMRLVEEKKADGKDTSFTENFLAELKNSSLVDMDGIRAKIIQHILCWRGEGPCCGNGSVGDGEVCDGENLAGNTCVDLGFSGGELVCKEDCTFDTCGCTPSRLSISFADPTPAANAVVTGSEVSIGTSIESNCGVLSGFIDWNDSLVGYWDFNEGSGETAADKSTHGRGGTLNGPLWETGKFGSALRFDGVDDSVTCGNLGIPQNGPATIEGWFYFTEFAKEKGVHVPLFTNLYQHTANNQFYISGTNDYFPAADLIRKNEWVYVALTYSGTSDTGNSKLYVNGISVAIILQGGVENIGALSNFSVGTGVSRYFNGLIDEVRVWNRVLSRAEIEASYDASRYGLHATFGGLQDGPAHCYAYVSNALGQSARTETRNFTVDVP